MIKELLVRDSMCLLMSILVVAADTNVTNKKKHIMNRKDREEQ